MIIITGRCKERNTYKCYSVNHSINTIEKAFNSNEWYNDFKVEFNSTVLTTNHKETNAIAVISYDTTKALGYHYPIIRVIKNSMPNNYPFELYGILLVLVGVDIYLIPNEEQDFSKKYIKNRKRL